MCGEVRLAICIRQLAATLTLWSFLVSVMKQSSGVSEWCVVGFKSLSSFQN